MKKFFKKYKDYFLLIGITFLLFIILFIIKGIYPFGNKSLILGDMAGQITAYYYYFHDCIRTASSFLVDFTSSNGVNFFGIISYYLLNPFSLLLLLV